MADNTQPLPDSPFAAAAQQSDNLPDSPFSSAAQADPNKAQGPLSGKYADWYFSQAPSAVSSVANVMSNIGQGAAQGWGATTTDLPRKASEELDKLPDYLDSKNSYFKSLNEALVRPVINNLVKPLTLPIAGGVEGLVRGGLAVAGGFAGGFQGVGQNLESAAKTSEQAVGFNNPVSATLGETGDISGAIPEGFLPDAVHTPDVADLTAEARSKAIVGEGEQGFFNTKPVSDDNLEARQQAAKDAGISPEEVTAPEPPQLDIHSVVRQMNPDLFKEVDRLNEIKQNYQDNISYARSQDIADVQRDLDIQLARTQEDNPGAVAVAQNNIENLQRQLEDLQSGSYGPRATQTQQTFMDADYKLRDLLPDVQATYKHAQEIMMTPEEIAENSELANPRLQELTEKIQTDGLTKQEWNEYNVLSKAQETKVAEKPTPNVAPTQEEGQVVPPKIAAEAGGVEGTNTTGGSLLKPEWKHQSESTDLSLEDRPMFFTKVGTENFYPGEGRNLFYADVNLKNPLVESAMSSDKYESIKNALIEEGVSEQDSNNIIKDMKEAFVHSGQFLEPKFQKALEKLGYDGVISDKSYRSPHAVAFHPKEQVKLAEKAEDVNTTGGSLLKPVESTGESRPLGLSSRVSAEAIKDGITKDFSDLPEYNTTNWDVQGERAAKFIDSNYKDAEAVALGKKQPPDGILNSAVYVGVSRVARANGDLDLIQRLANSPFAAHITRAGQETGYLSQMDETDPVRIIQNLVKARQEAAKVKGVDISKETANIQKDLGNRINKGLINTENWKSFLKSIECDY